MVKKKQWFIICLLFSTCFSSCGSYPYKQYVMDLPTYEEGILKGKEESDDLPIKVCEPRPDDAAPCVVYKSDVARTMEEDYISNQIRLEELEKRCGAE